MKRVQPMKRVQRQPRTAFVTKYSRLPRELREEIEARVRAEHQTPAELLEFLRSRMPGIQISRSTFYIHLRRYKAKQERFREAREIANVWGEMLLKDPNHQIGRMLGEILRLVAFQQLSATGDLEDGTDAPALPPPNELVLFATALQRLASADKLTAESELRLQQKLMAAEHRVKKVAVEGGLSHEAAEAIRRALLGDPDPADDEIAGLSDDPSPQNGNGKNGQ